ncbi:MAG: hypothetical protein NXI30_20800 [bacterium]|nr:hypothetical protein [bacterium]
MRTRDLNQNDQRNVTPDTGAAPTGAGPSAIDETRRRAQRLLDLADDTISQALSQNSERFLAQNRQQGGQ